VVELSGSEKCGEIFGRFDAAHSAHESDTIQTDRRNCSAYGMCTWCVV